eukprot:11194075-Lingulodinium_polyedra.AAC.1
MHDVAVEVAHGAGGLQEALGHHGVVEAVLARHVQTAAHPRHHRHDGRLGAVLRPGVVAVPVVTYLVGVPQRGLIGYGRVGAVPLDEA